MAKATDGVPTIVGVTGIMKFGALAAPEAHPDYPHDAKKYRIEFNTPKQDGGHTAEMKKLFAAVQHVGRRTWLGAESKKRMRAVVRTIEEGDATNSGQIGLFDGDEYKPEYNEGQYVLRASCKASQPPVFREWSEDEGKYVLSDNPPAPGDLVKVSLEVWAMKQHSRINFTIKAVQVVKDGRGFMPVTGGQPVTDTLLDETLDDSPEVLGLFAGLHGAPALTSGADAEHGYDDEGETLVFMGGEDDDLSLLDDEPEPPKKAPKKRAARKKAAAKVVEPDDVLPPDEAEGDEDDASGGLFDNL